MNETHFVNTPDDISIFVRPIPEGKGAKEWVLKLVTTDLNTMQVVVVERVLSDQFTDVKVVEDSANNGYTVTIADRTAAPTGNDHYFELTSANESIYDFTSYTEEGNSAKKCQLIIEDITMSLASSGDITDKYVTVKIESGGMANAYTHQVWHNVTNA